MKKQRGQALVEFALILPVAVALLGWGIDLYQLETTQANITYVAEATATCLYGGLVDASSVPLECQPAGGLSGYSTHVNNLLTALNYNVAQISAQWTQGQGNSQEITLYYAVVPLFPIPGISASNPFVVKAVGIYP